jgi:hypothetical protein
MEVLIRLSRLGLPRGNYKFKLSDIKLKQAKVVTNCLEEENSVIQYPYVCIIALFDEIDAKGKSKEVEIEYEYLAQDIIRYKEDKENTILWYYDNKKRKEPIYNINLKLKIDNQLVVDDKKLIGYPDKYIKTKGKEMTEFNWHIDKVNFDSYQPVSLDFPKQEKLALRKLVNFF